MKLSIFTRVATRGGVVVSLVMAVLAGPMIAPASAQAVPAIGAGSTFAAIALDQWRADVNRRQQLKVDYSPIGSVAGQNGFVGGQYDFASSDISLLENNLPSFPFTYAPIVAGGMALFYNLTDNAGRRINNIKLSAGTIGKIFTTPGTMYWDDPAIALDNPDLVNRLPRKELRRVARSEGSGTTAVFTNYIHNAAPEAWNQLTRFQRQFIADSPAGGGKFITEFDAGFRDAVRAQGNSWDFVRGSEQLAQAVATSGGQLQFNGYIGYAETGYALQKKLPIAYVKNASGLWVLPEARNVAVALLQARRNQDGTQNLKDVAASPRPEAYPISSYNYLVVRKKQPGDDPTTIGKGETIARYLLYSITEGQALAKELGYSPLPPNLVQQGLEVMRDIPGAPEPPALGNWGQFYLELKASAPAPVAQPPGAAGGPAAGGGAARPGVGGAAVKGNTQARAGAAAPGRPGATSGRAATGGAASGTGDVTSGPSGATDPTAGVDPATEAGVDGEFFDESGVVDGGTELAGGSLDLVPTNAAAVKVATQTPLGKMPLALLMLGFLLVPVGVMAWRTRTTPPERPSDHLVS